jgi:hypothetical protein
VKPELLPPAVEFYTEPRALGSNKRRYTLYPSDILPRPKGKQKKGTPEPPYLLVGFDTEYQTPEGAVTRKDIKEGRAKFTVLSYQFHARSSDGLEWSGIACPEDGKRMTIAEFLLFVLGSGAREHGIKNIPATIYLVGHFTRADIPAFEDFRRQFDFLANLRSTIVTVDAVKRYVIEFANGMSTDLHVRIRDSMLLTPQMSKSLANIGKLVGVDKRQLHPDPQMHKKMIARMAYVREHHWDEFREYAMNDARICCLYIERIIQLYQEVAEKRKVPITLTSIGVDLLQKAWDRDFQGAALDLLGKEEITERVFDKALGRYKTEKRVVDLPEVDLHSAYAVESYHGGRNEQFWFGPCFEDAWTDCDLASAYPTAMSLISRPDWRNIRTTTDLNDFGSQELAFALLDFEFPTSMRYPTMPVRTDNGLVFPLTGTTFCAAPEIALARSLGAKLKIRYGVYVPTDKSVPIFSPFIKECLELRRKADKDSLTGLFWKEISNSTYGKTAQGLRQKRVYDMRDRLTHILPPSRITNPFFAAYITSFVRALLGEIMNALPATSMVFSCTTDGFLTNASAEAIESAQSGELARLFAAARAELTGNPTVLETKHEIRQPLGWRTRGQATLKAGSRSDKGEDFIIVLAKGGIFTPKNIDTRTEQNDYIVEMFFNRDPDHEIVAEAFTGIRDIVENDADLVQKLITRRLNMEFDWKRRPLGVCESSVRGHVAFSTVPWRHVDEFRTLRTIWDDYTKVERVCIKTLAAFNNFARYVEIQTSLPDDKRKYLSRTDPDIRRLRKMLCSAWQHSEAGFTGADRQMSATSFASILTELGVRCSRADVENGKKKVFVEHDCPPTAAVKEALGKLKTFFPKLLPAKFLYLDLVDRVVSMRGVSQGCPFIGRCKQSVELAHAA